MVESGNDSLCTTEKKTWRNGGFAKTTQSFIWNNMG